MANIALVDDHALLRNGLSSLIKNLGHTVLLEAYNGKDFISKLNTNLLPDVVLMDINMPEMDGYETTQWIKENHPEITVMALSMYDTEGAILRMIKCGAKGYILKDSEPAELHQALESLFTKGYYYSDLVNEKIVDVLNSMDGNSAVIKSLIELSEKESEFLKYTCTELTYKEIAEKMHMSPRTIENYRDTLFERLNIRSRIGLAMFAVRNGLVNL
jgi:two-component system, NarL family, invasion response regulator UvrY